MFAEILSPQTLSARDLDTYLAKGWFRMRQTMFTTQFLCFQNQFYSAVWLRVNMQNTIQDSTFRDLRKRNSSFITTIQKAAITKEHEALYKQYKQGISFETSDNLHQLLNGYEILNIFNTFEINIYDKYKLIAAGFFDLGESSAAGIASFYHPAYKKYSLGKYLIYSKMEFCQKHRFRYFYPGYVAPGYPLFSYKLSINKKAVEYFSLNERQWLSYTAGSLIVTPLQAMQSKLNDLQLHLKARKINNSILYYRYFDACLDPYFSGYQLFDFPLFLYYFYATETATFRLIVYDLPSAGYQLLECSSISQMEFFENSNAIFSTELLQTDRILGQAKTCEKIISFL